MFALLLVAGSVGCSGDDDGSSGAKTAQQSLDDLHISDSPEQVVATAIERLDPGAVVGAELGATYLRVKYALHGFAWADAQCAVDQVVAIVTPEVFGTLAVVRLDDLGYDYPGIEASVRTCASPESLARIDAKPDATSTSIAGQSASNAAPDIDGTAVGTMLEAFYRLSADAIGLTSTETDCVVDEVLAGRDAAAFVDLALGRDRIDVDKTAPGVVSCLKDHRIDTVTPVAAKALLARQKTAKAEKDRVEALIRAQVDEMNSSTTVASSGG